MYTKYIFSILQYPVTQVTQNLFYTFFQNYLSTTACGQNIKKIN